MEESGEITVVLKKQPLKTIFSFGTYCHRISYVIFLSGYVHIEPISITFAYIPVLLAGCILDPLASTIVGTAFGLSSM